jgi:hypothetical protein
MCYKDNTCFSAFNESSSGHKKIPLDDSLLWYILLDAQQFYKNVYFSNLKFSQTGSIMRKNKRDCHGLYQRKRSRPKMGHYKPNGQLSLRSWTNRRRAKDRQHVGCTEGCGKTRGWAAQTSGKVSYCAKGVKT